MLRIELRTSASPAFAPAMTLYATSFPEHEQRLEPSQPRIILACFMAGSILPA